MTVSFPVLLSSCGGVLFAQPPLRCMSSTAELLLQAIRYFKRLVDWSELKPASHESHSCFSALNAANTCYPD